MAQEAASRGLGKIEGAKCRRSLSVLPGGTDPQSSSGPGFLDSGYSMGMPFMFPLTQAPSTMEISGDARGETWPCLTQEAWSILPI